MSNQPDAFNQLQIILADITGNDLDEIQLESHLEDDLGINLTEEFPRVLVQINREFGIRLDRHEVLDELSETGETVGALAHLIDDECELG